jgi:light-harvesting complex I chlorophyll a/b binding protein 1
VASDSAFGSELGMQAPIGFWDPMGFCKNGDVEDYKRRRDIELKHGRVAGYAAVCFIAPEYFKFPGYLSPSAGLKFVDVPSGLAAIDKVPVEGWLR